MSKVEVKVDCCKCDNRVNRQLRRITRLLREIVRLLTPKPVGIRVTFGQEEEI